MKMIKEEECESVTEAKTQSASQKINVLEKLAKYNQKKQQEKEDKMKASMSKASKLQKENQAVLNPSDKPETTKEHYIGISEYVSKTKGFSGILKQRYSDFHVYEVGMDGNVVHLTNQDIPDAEANNEEITEEEMSFLTFEQWNEIDEMMQSDEKKEVTIDITKKTKPERQSIHKVLRRKYTGITSNSGPVDGKTIMRIFKNDGKIDHRIPRHKYTQFVMYKENVNTMEALQILGRRLRCKPSYFSVAGTKDKRGITSQLVTVRGLEPRRILNLMQYEAKVGVGNFSFTDKALELGHLKGNRFNIVLRNVLGEMSEIEQSLQSLKEKGFINYYGPQRFGTRHVPTHHIGKQLLLGKWQEAIDLILEPPENPGKYLREYDLDMARVEYKTSRNAKKAYDKIKRNKYSIEAKVLQALSMSSRNLLGALDSIPRNMRLTYLHAYQSYVWNNMVSKRLSKLGYKPIVGDLVYAPTPEGQDADWYPEVEDGDAVAPELDGNEQAANGAETGETDTSNKRRAQRNLREVITIDESNIDNYTIYDVILPTPGYDVMYPANQVADWYTDLMHSDGLTLDNFKQSVKTYNLGGSYRLMMARPDDLQWKFVRYNDPTKTLVASDWEIMKNVKLAEAEVEDGTYLGLILEFSLPPSSYATMALREITKMDMSSQHQSSLNSAGGTESSPAKAEDGGPEAKKAKLDETNGV